MDEEIRRITDSLVLALDGRERLRFRDIEDLEIGPLVERYGLPGDEISALLISNLGAAFANFDGSQRLVDGHLVCRDGSPAADREVFVYTRGIGQENSTAVSGATGITDTEGYFSIQYGDAAVSVSVELRLKGRNNAAKLMVSPIVAARQHETLNLVVKERPRPDVAEFDRVFEAVTAAVDGTDIADLSSLVSAEMADDLLMISRAADIDARLVGLAAMADRLGTDGTSTAAWYAISRASGITDPARLAGVPADGIANVLRSGVESGVLPETFDVAGESAKLVRSVNASRLERQLDGSTETLGGLFASVGIDEARQLAVLDAAVGSENAWEAVQGAIGPDGAASLRFALDLSHFTGLRADARAEVAGELDGDLSQLARLGYYQPASWDENQLEVAEDSSFDAARLAAAAKVDLAFPVETLAHQVRSGSLEVEHLDEVLAVLDTGKLDLRTTTVDSFVLQLDEADPDGIGDALRIAAPELRKLQRVTQMASSPAGREALMSAAATDAHTIARYENAESFAQALGVSASDDLTAALEGRLTSTEAAVIFNQANAITASVGAFTMSVHALVNSAQHSLTVWDTPDPDELAELDMAQVASIEQLMGSVDFCACEHCRSIFSPAAYLVALLEFLDDPSDGPDDVTPYDAYVHRCPQSVNIPLTCENTNTELPYIDLVNEIMEFEVAGSDLKDLAPDVGDGASRTLIVEPDILDENVYQNAYLALADAEYPIGLPYDVYRATVRRFLDQFGRSLAEVFETFADRDDKAEMTAVVHERLGIDPAVSALLLKVSNYSWWRLYGYEEQSQVRLDIGLDLARRLGISLADFVRLLETQFVNPGLSTLAHARWSGVDNESLLRFLGVGVPLDQDAVADVEATLGTTWTAAVRKLWDSDVGKATILLLSIVGDNDDQASLNIDDCDFAKIAPAAVHPNQSDLDGTVDLFRYRLNLFVRLRFRLGWSTTETDSLLGCFSSAGDLLARQGISTSVERCLIVADGVERIRRVAPANVHREDVAVVFLGERASRLPGLIERRLLAVSDFFKQLLGDALSGSPAKPILVGDALLDLQAGSAMTGEEILVVLAHLNPAQNPAELKVSLQLVVDLLRYRTLASICSRSVRELVDLVDVLQLQVSVGSSDDPDSVRVAVDAIVRSVETLLTALDSGIGADDLARLGRNRLSAEADLGVLLGALGPALEQARADTAELLVGELTDETVSRTTGLVLDPDAQQRFMQWWSGAAEETVDRPAGLDLDDLAEINKAGDGTVWVSVDDHDDDKLFVRGVVTSERLAVAISVVPALDEALTKVRVETRTFLAGSLLSGITVQVQDRADAEPIDLLFSGEDRGTVLHQILGQRLRTSRAVGALADYLGVDRERTQRLLASNDIIQTDSGPDGIRLIEPLLELSVPGLSARVIGKDSPPFTVPSGGWLASDRVRLKQNLGNGSWEVELAGAFRSPTTGPIRFHNPLADTAASTLTVTQSGPSTLEASLEWSSTTAELSVDATAGRYYELVWLISEPRLPRFDKKSDYYLEWESGQFSRSRIDSAEFTPLLATRRAAHAAARANKVVDFAATFGFDDDELRFATSYAPLESLPVAGSETPDQEEVEAIAAIFRAAIGYRALRDEWVGGRPDLVMLLLKATNPVSKLQELTSRTDIAELADLYGPQRADSPHPFATLPGLIWLRRLLAMITHTGISGRDLAALANARKPSQSTVGAEAAASVRNAVRARYDEAQWANVAKPIFDDIRAQRRNALVSFLSNKHKLTQDQLFERYLVDPGMEPVVLASRIQLAISSVQLFVQRCLLNLESTTKNFKIKPSDIRRTFWPALKTYRVWEANRKIFAHPENWLEPEWRNDKTHLFEELESTLLSQDVDDTRAEAALHRYLVGLESIARLEIMSTFWETGDRPTDSRVLHVIGRTYAQPHKWFYRTKRTGRWSPWEPITAKLEGDHVVIGVWQGKPHIFWLELMERFESAAPTEAKINSSNGNIESLEAPSEKASRSYEASVNWVGRTGEGWGEAVTTGFQSLDQEFSASGIVTKNNYAPGTKGLGLSLLHLVPNGRAIRIVLSSQNQRGVEYFKAIGDPDYSMGDAPEGERGIAWEVHAPFQAPSRVEPSDSQMPPFGTPPGPIAGTDTPPARYGASPGEPQHVIRGGSGTNLDWPTVFSAVTSGQFVNASAPVDLDGSTGFDSLGNFMKPVFFQDAERTFLIEPIEFAPQSKNQAQPQALMIEIIVNEFYEVLPDIPEIVVPAFQPDWLIHESSAVVLDIDESLIDPGTLLFEFAGGAIGNGGFVAGVDFDEIASELIVGSGGIFSALGELDGFNRFDRLGGGGSQ